MTSKEEEKDVFWNVAGEIRPSQLITNFGPGSVVNMLNDTVMIYGCHTWPGAKESGLSEENKKRYKILHHQLLEKKLFGGAGSFRMPLSQERSKNVPCFSFPQWGVCKKCGLMHKHETRPPTKKGFTCWSCEKNKVKSDDCQLSHARFAVICPKGHIDEFPWVEWVHFDKKTQEIKKCEKNNPQLYFTNDQKSSALKAYGVRCTCGVYRPCSGATERSTLKEMGIVCQGRRPWIDSHAIACFDDKGNEQAVRGIQIRATGMWYSINTSAIKVPRWLHAVNLKFESKEGNVLHDKILDDRRGNRSFEAIVDWEWDQHFKKVAEDILKDKKKHSEPNRSDEDIKNEIIQKLEEIFSDTTSDDKEIPKQIDILNQEFDDFIKIDDTTGRNYEDYFQMETSQIDKNKKIFSYLDTLKLVNRITTISTLRGFTRDKPPDPINPDRSAFCDIASDRHLKESKWLPAVQVKGEGLFFSLNKEMLSKWEKDKNLQDRCNVIIESYANHSSPGDDVKAKEKRAEIKKIFNSKFILIHTLSHLIIKSLVAEAGYDEPSLRERIYWDDKDRNGILIYASGSSEGSLGGLVRLGKPQLFEKVLTKAIEKSEICSRDPVCEDSNPIRDKASQLSRAHQLNGSSCHSCCFVSETSCAFFNQLLDRWIINNKDTGFFKDFLNESR